MSSNRSGDRTKVILADSLRDLMKKKSFDKIKVLEIVDNCNVNRQTFYYHFQDIYSLVEWMYLRKEKEIYKGNLGEDWPDMLNDILSYVEEDKDVLINLMDSNAASYFNDFIFKVIKKIIRKEIEFSELKNENSSQLDFLCSFYTYAFCGVLSEWIKENPETRKTKDEFIKYIEISLSGNFRYIIEKYKTTLKQ